jgi:hypothetical protein
MFLQTVDFVLASEQKVSPNSDFVPMSELSLLLRVINDWERF